MAAWVCHTSKGNYEDDFLDNSHVGVGYECELDLSVAESKEEIREHLIRELGKPDGHTVLWRFLSDVEEGDLVVVPIGPGYHIGRVNGGYAYRTGKDPQHVRPVEWLAQELPEDAIPTDILGSVKVEPAIHRIRKPDAEARILKLATTQETPLDAYIKRSQAFIKSGQLDKDEIDYKLKIINDLGAARTAMLSHVATWPDIVKKALSVGGGPVHWMSLDSMVKWFAADQDEAKVALMTLWTEDDTPPPERINNFLGHLPVDVVSGPGSRVRSASGLMMLLGTDYPPFKTTEFDKAYSATGYDRPPPNADGGVLYEHALGFLDRLLARTQELGYTRPANRLEAQSVVWMMSGEPPEESENGENEHEPEVALDLEALAKETYLDPDFLRKVGRLLEEKGQVIFQGPPGTGKTYVARKLALALAGARGRVRLVQFHPSYAYEDFVQGFRPTLEDGVAGFKLRDGPLVQMAEQARQQSDKKHFLVIDEINRGNLAKVFGELYFLLEYRGPDHEMRLQYSDDEFSLPDNLYIIGTMNTADRSIALVDLALRRRFSFVEFHPNTEPVKGLLGRWLDKKAPELRWVADVVDHANGKLGDGEAAIGPSYFMKHSLDEERVERIWKHDVLPYVEEQLYGQHGLLAEFELEALQREAAGNTPSGGGDDAAGEEEAATGSRDDDA